MFRIYDSKAGFTLIELMTALILVSLLMGAVWAVYNIGFKVFYSQEARAGVIPQIERTLYDLGSDLRQANSVTAATQTSITFTADTDSNGANETIQYIWSGTAGNPLNKVTTATKAMISSVSSLSFSYYNSSEALLSFPVTASQVKRVVINITAANDGESFTVRSSADLRCL